MQLQAQVGQQHQPTKIGGAPKGKASPALVKPRGGPVKEEKGEDKASGATSRVLGGGVPPKGKHTETAKKSVFNMATESKVVQESWDSLAKLKQLGDFVDITISKNLVQFQREENTTTPRTRPLRQDGAKAEAPRVSEHRFGHNVE